MRNGGETRRGRLGDYKYFTQANCAGRLAPNSAHSAQTAFTHKKKFPYEVVHPAPGTHVLTRNIDPNSNHRDSFDL